MFRTKARRLFVGRVKCGLAVGMWQDHDAHWPIPLPPPLPSTSATSAAEPPASSSASRQPRRHTLVLDVDETLLHTLHQDRHPKNANLAQYYCLLRPHVDIFLREVSQHFEVVLWTAGVASYAGAVANLLERTVGWQPSPMYDAERLIREMTGGDGKEVNPPRAAAGEEAEDHVHWYVLSRSQTLEQREWMKYIPILGRESKSVIMIDDNVRSFPLTPRNGVRIDRFEPDNTVLNGYYYAIEALKLKPEETPHPMSDDQRRLLDFVAVAKGNAELAERLAKGLHEIERLEKDRALMDLLPMLKRVASSADAVAELDHWRPDEYTMCDNFLETMNRESFARVGMLGKVLPERRPQGPIAAYKPMSLHNYPLTTEATQWMHEVWAADAAKRGASKRKGVSFSGGALPPNSRSML